MGKVTRSIALLLTASLAVGCASFRANHEFFARSRPLLAMVTVQAHVSGLATSDTEDKELASQLATVSVKELGKSRRFRLAPENAVLSSRSYKAIANKGPMFMGDLAPGYKGFSVTDERANMRVLAKELKASGFIVVSASYNAKKSGFAIGGLLPVPIPLSAGSVTASVTYVIVVYDVNGEVLWQDTAELDSEDSVGTVMGVGNYKALYPKLTDLAKAASRQVLANLDTNLARK